tara:strand:+ start:445 stop:789 length:345 start_codon:yes stop_codon:yes gene_type:complete
MAQMREFRVADNVKVKKGSDINVRRPYENTEPYATKLNPSAGDLKRSPKFMEGIVGQIKKVYGWISIPPDHSKRTSYYQVAFNLSDISDKATSKDKVYVDVFEDWLERAPRSEL